MMALALTLGRTVGELEATLTESELLEWMAFFQVVPFGPEAANANAGAQMALLANINRKKGARPFKVDDFMIGERPPKRRLTVREQQQAIAMLAKQPGAERVH